MQYGKTLVSGTEFLLLALLFLGLSRSEHVRSGCRHFREGSRRADCWVFNRYPRSIECERCGSDVTSPDKLNSAGRGIYYKGTRTKWRSRKKKKKSSRSRSPSKNKSTIEKQQKKTHVEIVEIVYAEIVKRISRSLDT